MAVALPPWLQISPSDFTNAFAAGGQAGREIESNAAKIAQGGLLSAAQLAQAAAIKGAELRAQREAIQAQLAQNAARVSADRAAKAMEFANRQRELDLVAKAAEQEQASEAAKQSALSDAQRRYQLAVNAGEDQAAAQAEILSPVMLQYGMKVPEQKTPQAPVRSIEYRMLEDADALEAAGRKEEAQTLRDILKKRSKEPGLTMTAPTGNPFLPNSGSVRGPIELVQQFTATNAPAGPLAPNVPQGTNVISYEDFLRWKPK